MYQSISPLVEWSKKKYPLLQLRKQRRLVDTYFIVSYYNYLWFGNTLFVWSLLTLLYHILSLSLFCHSCTQAITYFLKVLKTNFTIHCLTFLKALVIKSCEDKDVKCCSCKQSLKIEDIWYRKLSSICQLMVVVTVEFILRGTICPLEWSIECIVFLNDTRCQFTITMATPITVMNEELEIEEWRRVLRPYVMSRENTPIRWFTGGITVRMTRTRLETEIRIGLEKRRERDWQSTWWNEMSSMTIEWWISGDIPSQTWCMIP